DGPVVATSVKDDLVAATVDWRRAHGRCWVFDPTSDDASATWSPLAEASTWSGAQRMATWLVEATPARGGMTDGAFWFASAAKLLAPLLLAASRSGATMADVVRWNNTSQLDDPLAILEVAALSEAAAALAAGTARDPRLRSSIATTLETVLAPFEDPTIARATASCDIDPATLLRGGHSLYLCGPSHEQARVQGLFAALVSSVVAAAVDQVHRQGHPLDPPLLVVLDEAANIAPLRDLDTLASTAAGMGIQLVTICQDLAQLAARYGPERSRTMANNHRAKVVLSGISDLTTLDLVSGLAGDTAVTEETVTRDLRDGRRTRSSGVAFRRLVATDELRRIGPGDGVLVYGHLPVARIRLRPWYADPVLRRRVP
ncbi:MAG: type IV secretory system conjugative DNA transfer family protein, partial [Actinomycetota bacterium]|nr:type IV secretory system conjugative DNA transfer family protein [Actinomycetota bacterium]